MTQTVSSGTRVTPADLAAFCIEAMRVSGLNEEDARLTAEVLVTTDTLATFTHGTRQLRGLLKNVRTGRLSATAHEEIVGRGAGLGHRGCALRHAAGGLVPLDGAGDAQGQDSRHRLRRRPAQQPLRRRRLLRQSGRAARHVRHVHVQRGPLHDRAGIEGQGAGHQPHRLRRARRRGEARLPGHRHQRGRRDQDLLRPRRWASRSPTTGWWTRMACPPAIPASTR